MSHERRQPPSPDDDSLIASLRAVDRLIARALAAAPAVYGWEAGRVQFRGLFIGEEDVPRLLSRSPGDPVFGADTEQPLGAFTHELAPLTALAARYGLTPFDKAIVLVALAPEIDLRYERLYAFLQDDVTRRRPSVDLILNLLCVTADEKLTQRAHFAPDAPLVREHLIHLEADSSAVRPTWLARAVSLDEQVVRALLGEPGLDSRLAQGATCSTPSTPLVAMPLPEGHADALARLVAASRQTGEPLRLLFHGDPMPLKHRAAEAVAHEAGLPLLSVALARLIAGGRDLQDVFRVICRDAQRLGAMLFLDVDGVPTTDVTSAPRRTPAGTSQTLVSDIVGAIARHEVSAVVATSDGWASEPGLERARFMEVAFPPASFNVRRTCWRTQARAAGIELNDRDLSVLAERFRLHPDQIDAAAVGAVTRASWAGDPPAARHVFAAARALSGQALASLARRIEPVFSWEDLVLPASVCGHLHALCGRVANRHRVLGEWGFERTLPLGKGVTALFAGSSGVGKTMAAEVIARELQLDLYKIDLSGIVSKYIGETEKNLERVFTAAESASAILFFDEADALFGKRSEVRDSHDRYANLEISYLLQKMEAYDGVAILASNLRHSLDDAFVRRLAFTIHFPFPDQVHRHRLWMSIWPAAAPVDEDVDREWLATHFKLTGGNIKNVALASAFLAAEAGCAIGMRHVLAALEREYQKMGKPLDLTGIAPPILEVAS